MTDEDLRELIREFNKKNLTDDNPLIAGCYPNMRS